jgi:FkbM family methyltransferase
MRRLAVAGKRMPSLASAFREKFHPLHQIRRVRAFRKLLALVDIPIWAHVHGVRWKVRIRLVRDLSHLLLSRSPEPHVTALFETVVELFRPKIFWDVGAYFGYYGFLVKSLDGDVKVVFCEPDPDNTTLIRQTRARIPVDGLELLQAAVSDENGSATFIADPVSGSTGTLEADESPAERHWGETSLVMVRTVTLEDELGESGDLDLLKIDVEGHEEKVFRGASQTLQRCQPVVVFECFHGGDEICSTLEGLGYTILDAERLGPRTAETENFLGLPAKHRGRQDELLQQWRARLN